MRAISLAERKRDIIEQLGVTGVCLSCRVCINLVDSFANFEMKHNPRKGWFTETRFIKETGFQHRDSNGEGVAWTVFFSCEKRCPYELERMMEDEDQS